MPIYEYQCPDCGHQFEQLQKISDEPVRVCPNCQEPHLKKLVSQTSFVLKGGGWYKDHYGLKAAGGKSDAKSDGAAASESAPAATETKTAEKPAAAAPAASEAKRRARALEEDPADGRVT